MNIETTDNSPLLQECIEELISSKIDEGKGRTAGNYRSAWNKLSTFLGPRVTEFTFADLTTDFLHHYLLWLMQGEDGKQALKPGSLDFYIRNKRQCTTRSLKINKWMFREKARSPACR